MRRQKLALLAMIPVLVLGLPACGGIGNKGNAAPQSKKTDEITAMRNFAKCMRDNGVNMSDPVQDGPGSHVEVKGGKGDKGMTPEKMQAAEAKCRHLQPNGGNPPKMSPEQVAQARKHAKCMREHGINMPDPDDEGKVTIKMTAKPGEKAKRLGVGEGPNNQKFKDADKACRHLQPRRGESPGTNEGNGG
jgi:hypothetical protein